MKTSTIARNKHLESNNCCFNQRQNPWWWEPKDFEIALIISRSNTNSWDFPILWRDYSLLFLLRSVFHCFVSLLLNMRSHFNSSCVVQVFAFALLCICSAQADNVTKKKCWRVLSVVETAKTGSFTLRITLEADLDFSGTNFCGLIGQDGFWCNQYSGVLSVLMPLSWVMLDCSVAF